MMTSSITAGSPFLRMAALCWMVSSLTTLCLIFLPYFYAPVDGDPVGRFLDPVYMARVWVALVHPLIVLVGAVGVAAVRLGAAPGWAAGGFVFFLLWAGVEAVQQGLTLVTLNWTWRAEYLHSVDAAARDRLGGWITAFDGVSDGLFFVLLIAFVVANVFFAVAVWGGPPIQRLVAAGFALASALGVISALTSFGPGVLPDAVMAVLYPLVQPPARMLTGIWLWRHNPAGNQNRSTRANL
jgi:hypothetical protein